MKRLLFGAFLAACTTWAAAAPPSIDIPEWTPCAHEGQTCYTPGPAQVRFGGGGRYSDSKNAVGNIDCSIANFGDPARRVSKICEYKLGWARGTPHPVREANTTDWVDCANEGELCRFRGTRLVRFGVEGAYYYRTEEREIRCTVDEFGDPVRRVPKQCQYKRSDQDRDGSSGRDRDDNRQDDRRDNRAAVSTIRDQERTDRPANRWVPCASERETCRVSEPTTVRFGLDNAFNYRQVDREAFCTSYLFGDPVPGVKKRCEANTVPIDRMVARRPAPNEIPPMDDRLWEDCGREGQLCEFRGSEHVRFGANGVFKVDFATNGMRCTEVNFGGDPARGLPKRCSIYRP